jgi:hypothetical protein
MKDESPGWQAGTAGAEHAHVTTAATYTAVSLDVITAQRVEDLVTPGDWSLVGPTARG